MGVQRRVVLGAIGLAPVLLAACGTAAIRNPLAQVTQQAGSGVAGSTPAAKVAVTATAAVSLHTAPIGSTTTGPHKATGTSPAGALLLAAADLPAGFVAEPTANGQLHKGPGNTSATARFTRASGTVEQLLYIRVSQFLTTGAAMAEYKQEDGDIGRSATALPPNGQKIGDAWLGYTVDSGAGTAATSSVGTLVVSRNYLVSLVLTGAPQSLSLPDLWQLTQQQVEKVATAT